MNPVETFLNAINFEPDQTVEETSDRLIEHRASEGFVHDVGSFINEAIQSAMMASVVVLTHPKTSLLMPSLTPVMAALVPSAHAAELLLRD